MSITPNTSVKPAASRNNINPNCKPFKACSRRRIVFIVGQKSRGSGPHLASARIGVRVVLKDGADCSVGDTTLGIARDDAQVVVLDRVVVVVEAEGAAN